MQQGATLARGGRNVTFPSGQTVILFYDLAAHYWLENRLNKSLGEIAEDLNTGYRASDIIAIITAGLLHAEPKITEEDVRGRGYALDIMSRLAIGVALSNASISDEELKEYTDLVQKGALKEALEVWLADKDAGRPTGSGGGNTGKSSPSTVAAFTPKNSGGSPSEN